MTKLIANITNNNTLTNKSNTYLLQYMYINNFNITTYKAFGLNMYMCVCGEKINLFNY